MAEKLEDLNLPKAPVLKIVKDALPENINIGKDARTALTRAAAVFVMYISSHASQEAQKGNRKTMIGQDVIDALANLEFEEFVEPLNASLKSYKDTLKQKKDEKQKLKKGTEDVGEENIVEEEVDEEVEDGN